jgi:hypothetical protein
MVSAMENVKPEDFPKYKGFSLSDFFDATFKEARTALSKAKPQTTPSN